MQYAMKDLGYTRTPTSAMLRVAMSDGSLWDVPAQIVADSRDENYSDEQEDTIGYIRKGTLDVYDLHDWARNNMNWDEVCQYATLAERKEIPVDYQEGWVNGDSEIVGTL